MSILGIQYKEKIQKELETNPVVFGDFQCKPKDQDVYLGDVISSRGLEASVEATIAHRLGKVKGAMFAQKAIIEDFRLQAVGGMARYLSHAALKLRELGRYRN